MAKSAQEVAQKWSTNLANSTTSITSGVNAVTEAPGVKAAAKVDLWMQKLQASRDKWMRNVSAVPLSTWKEAMISKGIPRVATGASQAQPKFAAFMNQFLPHLEAGRAQIDAMPKGDLAQAAAKMVAQMNYNAQFQYRRGA